MESEKIGMRVSIAMATYNGAKHIREQLNSLASQTYLPYELVVCDDGSSDDTLSIINEFAKMAPFRVVIYKNNINLGYGENFLHAATYCTGDWIAFCDQDDVWLPTKLETSHSYMIDGVTMIYHSAKVVDENLTALVGANFQEEVFNVLPCNTFLPWKSIAGFTIIFDAKLPFFQQYKDRPHDPHRIDKQIAHDQWVPFLATIFGKIVVISSQLVLYRQHNSNVMGASLSPLDGKLSKKRIFSCANYQELSNLSIERATFLLSLIKQSDNSFAEVIEAAYQRYTRQAEFLRLRHIQYTNISFAHRAWLIATLFFRAGYGGTRLGGLGIKAFVKDVLNLIYNFFGPITKIS